MEMGTDQTFIFRIQRKRLQHFPGVFMVKYFLCKMGLMQAEKIAVTGMDYRK